MEHSQSQAPQNLAQWKLDVEAWAAHTQEVGQVLRHASRDLKVLPPDWYVVTEVMLAIDSLLYALRELMDPRD